MLTLWAAQASCARAEFVVWDLGTLPGGNQSQGYAISPTGSVTGVAAADTGYQRAFVAAAPGTMAPSAPLPGGQTTQGYGINGSGVVTGSSDLLVNGKLATHAITASGGMTHDLGTLPGGLFSVGYAINATGEVAGASDTGGGMIHAFIASGGKPFDLGTLGGALSQASALNDAGLVTGWSQTSFGATLAFRTDGTGPMQPINPLPGDSTSFGTAVNNLGLVTGYSVGIDGHAHAFVTDASGTMLTPLGALGGSQANTPFSINSQGAIVGESGYSEGASHAFLWTRQGGMVDLNALINPSSGWLLESARGINDLGEITGFGALPVETSTGVQVQTHAFLITSSLDPSAPEPPSLILIVLGAAGLGCWKALCASRRWAGA